MEVTEDESDGKRQRIEVIVQITPIESLYRMVLFFVTDTLSIHPKTWDVSKLPDNIRKDMDELYDDMNSAWCKLCGAPGTELCMECAYKEGMDYAIEYYSRIH